MAAPYVKRYPGGFLDLPNQTTPVDSAFLNAVETALLHLLGEAPANDEVGVWTGGAGGGLVYQKITNAQIAAGAAIDKSKLAALNITDADIAAAAGIAKSKLGALNIADADIQAAAAIAISKLAGYPADIFKTLRGDGSWAAPKTIYAIATKAANQSVANNTVSGLVVDTQVADTSNMFDPGTPGRIYATVAGVYMACAYVSWQVNSAGLRQITLFKNGTTAIRLSIVAAAASDINHEARVVLPLAVGDYINAEVYQNSGAALNAQATTYPAPTLELTMLGAV